MGVLLYAVKNVEVEKSAKFCLASKGTLLLELTKESEYL